MTDIQFITLITLIVSLSVIPWLIMFFFGRKIRTYLRRRKNTRKETIVSIQEITTAYLKLAKLKRGATIVIKQNEELDSVIADPTELNANLSSELLINIFEGDKSPLHDGAVIVNGSKVESAAATITTISSQKLPKQFGTRHRSGLGLSEEKDAIVVVLSEETQKVTIFKHGKYTVVKDLKEMRTEITNKLIEKEDEE